MLARDGGLRSDPERVDGSHPGHPGQTFDYFGERIDGQRLAIEVVRAWDEPWMESSHVWPDLARRVEASARDHNASVTGLYAMSVRLDREPRTTRLQHWRTPSCSATGAGSAWRSPLMRL